MNRFLHKFQRVLDRIRVSPGCKFDLETLVPALACENDVLGSDTPSCLYTYDVNPEQSNPLGVVPPHLYGVPRYCLAMPSTPEPAAFVPYSIILSVAF